MDARLAFESRFRQLLLHMPLARSWALWVFMAVVAARRAPDRSGMVVLIRCDQQVAAQRRQPLDERRDVDPQMWPSLPWYGDSGCVSQLIGRNTHLLPLHLREGWGEGVPRVCL
jgi:hypothetical protein